MARLPVEGSGAPQNGTQLSVSTTFFPAAALPGLDHSRSDLIIFTRDRVVFYCHKSVLKSKSANDFAHLLPTSPQLTPPASLHLSDSGESDGTPEPSAPADGLLTTIVVTETSSIFNIVLHLIYPGLSCSRYGPTIETIAEALAALPKYGLPVPEAPSDVWNVLLSFAPEHPLRVYAIGAANGCELICAQASSFTLGSSLSFLTEADALTMGPIYLRRLSFLHAGRIDALKRIIATPPEEHEDCEQGDLAWKEGVAHILLSPQLQNTSVPTLVATFGPLAGTADCPQCNANIQARINDMCAEWDSVPRTI